MKCFEGSLLCALVVAGGILGTLLDDAPAGRLVASQAERSAVMGAACYAQDEATMRNICSGSDDNGSESDCKGCGCTLEHPPKEGDAGYAAEKVNCNSDPACKFPFRRGSCKGE